MLNNMFYLIGKYNNEDCLIQKIDKKELAVYSDILKYSNKIKKYFYIEKIMDEYQLYFKYENKTEYKVKNKLIHKILIEIFNNSSYEQSIKKKTMRNLNNIYKVLDNKFTYFEMRIREIELKPIKEDVDWIILSKYYILLDSKIYLYDLQQDIFKFIDKELIVKYGLIPYLINQNSYSMNSLLMDYNLYYGPISMLYVREYCMLEEYDLLDDINKLDEFNQKYFCFMIIYILILNLNFEINMNLNSVSNYLNITNKIKDFIHKYKVIIEK